MPLTLSIAFYFAVAATLWMGRSRLRGSVATVAAAPFVAQLVVISAWTVRGDQPSSEAIGWIPSLGVTIGLQLDMASVLLTAVVSGIGLLIVIYSHAYFGDADRRARFLALMAMFTGGMAGIVASDELFGLFLFWEITTIASYLLIGFDDEKASARAAALQAILVTTSGGLAMLAGFVILAIEGGTTSISALVEEPPTGPLVTVALVLVLLGAFTKSAQFPFHFWLPGAMAAPTPASAFLHSATMVKAGIVLLLFLEPGFSDTTVWLWGVTGTGLVTMSVGAVVALRQTDLKLLLAHGTVSQLGFMVALLGLGYRSAALAVLIAHSLFKAALFLVTGIVDKATGTRDTRQLSGVASGMPLVAGAGAVAALSMAGIPPMLGFVTKEAAFDLLISNGDWVALMAIAAASIATVAYAAAWWFGAFGSRGSDETPVERPQSAMVLPTVVLGSLTIALGVNPAPLGKAIADATGQDVKLVLWPGLKPALVVSTLVVVAGAAVFLYLRDARRLPSAERLGLPTGAGVYRSGVAALNRVADGVTGIVQNGSLPVYLAVILTSVLLVPTVTWILNWEGTISLRLWNTPAEGLLLLVVGVGAIAATRAQRRMAAALLLGVVGYAVAGIYVLFSAPDLALTQLLIETLTVALFAFVLARLPRRFGADPVSLSRRVRIVVAVLVGVFVTAAAALTSTVEPDRSLADTYVAESLDAGGTNVVNIILTNFRALDTLGEITVLVAAAIGITALLAPASRRRSGST